jgi:AraC family transcriptional regulator
LTAKRAAAVKRDRHESAIMPRMARRPSTWNDHRERIARVVGHVERHLDDTPDLRALASMACLSEFHFHRVFRAVTGESVVGHLRRLRLERAARRLRHAGSPIVEVALEAGFGSHETFTRAFTAHFGVAPSAYRAVHRPPVRRPDPPSSDARVEERQPMRLAAVRHVGPYEHVGQAWKAVFAWAGRAGATPAGPPVGLCWDDPEVTAPGHVRYDACLPIDGGVAAASDARLLEIGAGRFAVAMHRGAHERLGESYTELVRWALVHGHELGPEPSVDHYLRSPGDVAPEDLETLIALRVL